MHPASPQREGKHSEPWHNIVCVIRYGYNTTLTWSIRYFYVTVKIFRMITPLRFFAGSNGHAGDSDHPRELLMHTGRKPGKSWSWVDTSLSLVPRRDEYVRYGMVRLDEW